MNKKVKVFIIIFIIIILSFIGYLTYYKFSKNDNKKENKIELKDYKDQDYNINYEEKYEENILYSLIDNVEFTIDDNIGKLYIDNNKKLKITLNSNDKSIIEDLKFNTLYVYPSIDNIYLNAYALSENGKLYRISLVENNLDKLNIQEINSEIVITNLTDLKFKSYLELSNNSLVVLDIDGNMFDMLSNRLYDENIININDEYLLYGDMTISNIEGMRIVSNDKDVKVKNIIVLNDKGKFKNDPYVIIITNDDKIIYSINDEIYEYNKKVSKIENGNDKLIITFKDKSKMELNGIYDEELFGNK